MPRSQVKTASLKALGVGAALGGGVAVAAPHFSAGMRKSLRPHIETQVLKKQLGPLGTMSDLGPDQFKFAQMEFSMRAPLPDEVYVAAAHGHLSENEVTQLEAFAGALGKSASFSEGLRYGLGTAAASAVGGLAMVGVSHGIHSAYDALTFEKDLQATLKTRPELSTYPKEQVRLVYQSLRRLSPEIAKDPLTAGTYLARQFERRNPSDPHSLPTVELETARSLTQITGEMGKRRDTVRDALLQANAHGVQAGVGYMQESRQAQRQMDLEDRKIKASLHLEGEKARIRDQYAVAGEKRREERDGKDKLHEAKVQNLKDQMAGLHGMHTARVGDLEKKLQEMQQRQAGMTTHLSPTDYAAGSPATNEHTPSSLANLAAQMRAAGPKPPGPRRKKK